MKQIPTTLATLDGYITYITRKTNMALEKWMVGRQLTCLLGPGTFSGRYQEGTL